MSCSGCITSAETVMLESQSLDEFTTQLASEKAVIISVSPQSRASLAAHFNLSPLQVLKKLTTFFKLLGVKAVFDTSCSRDLTLIESCNEFVTRYRKHHVSDNEHCGSALPMLSSACPGWICYAEKKLGSYILPYMSSVKSPQQAIGSTIKRHVWRKMNIQPSKIYHVSVMPCYDKKLEAARDDFVFSDDHDESLRYMEVDLVLTSREVLELIQENSLNFNDLSEAHLDTLLTNVNDDGRLYGTFESTGGSGGYAETIFRYAAKTLFGRDIEQPLVFQKLCKSGFREIKLEVDGIAVLKFGLCYGFGNLVNVAKNIEMGKCDYHFLEVMSCRPGCLGGKGQVNLLGLSRTESMQAVETSYKKDVLEVDPFENRKVKALYKEWLGKAGSETAKAHLHTQYHPVAKNAVSLLSW